MKPSYDILKTFKENFEKGPFVEKSIPRREIQQHYYKLLDFEVNYPLGIPAGLLLNSRWVNSYARWGFDILTYKTVRSKYKESYGLPNCIYVDIDHQLSPSELEQPLIQKEPVDYPDKITITNSLGVPSTNPEKWQADVQKAKGYLSKGQILIVSVVGTYEDTGSFKELKEDFVLCAKQAEEAGADIIELNFSCPNSPASEGEVFTEAVRSAEISESVKRSIRKPVFIKVGYFTNPELLDKVIAANASFVDGIVSINTLKARVVKKDGITPALGAEREKSGVCGWAIKACGLAQAEALVSLRGKKKYDFCIIGVGGVMTPTDMEDYLNIGVDAVQSCTGAMFYPDLAYRAYEKSQGAVLLRS